MIFLWQATAKPTCREYTVWGSRSESMPTTKLADPADKPMATESTVPNTPLLRSSPRLRQNFGRRRRRRPKTIDAFINLSGPWDTPHPTHASSRPTSRPPPPTRHHRGMPTPSTSYLMPPSQGYVPPLMRKFQSNTIHYLYIYIISLTITNHVIMLDFYIIN